MIDKFLSKFDRMICRYLGLSGHEVDRPRAIKIMNNDIVIIKNIPFLRHKSYESFRHFNESSLSETNEVNKQKIGIAAGKALAKNLTISFDEVKIRES